MTSPSQSTENRKPRKSAPLAAAARLLRDEWPLAASVVTLVLFLTFGGGWLADLSSAAWFAFMLGWLFLVILLSAFAAVRHAEALAVKLGEPLGTLILTLSVTGIEVMMISAMMYASHEGS